jgi:hypothetical protein
MKSHYYVLPACIFILSCSSHREPLADLKLGTPDATWKSQVRSLVKSHQLVPLTADSSQYEYFWNLGDTTIRTSVSFNFDGVNIGSLRLKTVNLCHKYNYPMPQDTSNSSRGFSIQDVLGISEVCEKRIYDKVYESLIEEYSNPISVTYEPGYNPLDTSTITYHFRDKDKDVDLQRAYKPDNIAGAPPLYFSAFLTIQSTTYKDDYEKAKQTAVSFLKPEDYFTLRFSPLWTDLVNDQPYLPKRKVLVVQPLTVCNFAIPDHRNVVSAEGVLQILDRYADVLFQQDEVEFVPPKPVSAISRTDLFGAVAFPQDYRYWINLDNNNVPLSLREAVQTHVELSSKFIPKAVALDDGTIIK